MNHATAITLASAAHASPTADALTTVTTLMLSLIAIVGGGYLFVHMLRSDDPFGPGGGMLPWLAGLFSTAAALLLLLG